MTAVLRTPAPAATDSAIRVLVVDDSAVVRGLMTRALESDPDVRVVGTARHGEAALAWLGDDGGDAGRADASRADAVVLDVEMPVLDGLATLARLRASYPALPVVMASGRTRAGDRATVRALALGAVGCVSMPDGAGAAAAVQATAAELLGLVKAVARRPPGRRRAARRPPAAADCGETGPAGGPGRAAAAAPQVVVIGASTGGPTALTALLSGLRDLPLPVLVVQHMPPAFTPLLAAQLAKDTGRPTREAADGEPIAGGETLVAPGSFHLAVELHDGRPVARLNQDPPEHFCRPSVNPLFRSASRVYGPAVLAVMLTGMGDDGIEGSRELVAAGGRMIAQDEATSVVWGMPAAVARAGLADRVLPLPEIAAAVRAACRRA